MREFFKTLLTKLYYLSGIEQVGKLTDTQVIELLNALEDECNRKEWSKISPEVKARVIEDAVKTDNEFYGLNVKFVRRTLQKFWDQNGLRILEKELQDKPLEIVNRSPEELKRIDEIANAYRNQLANIESKHVDKLSHKEIAEEGDWLPKKKEIEYDPNYIFERQQRVNECRAKTLRDRHPDWTEEQIQDEINNMPI